jgi:hypothetical protein
MGSYFGRPIRPALLQAVIFRGRSMDALWALRSSNSVVVGRADAMERKRVVRARMGNCILGDF